MLNRDYGKKSSGPQKMADGGSVGFWERIKAGNIDQPGSEAYNRWGAGSVDHGESDPAITQHAKPTAVENVKLAEANSVAAPVPEVSTAELNAVADANDKATPAATAVAPVVRRRSSAGSSAAPRTMQGGIASGYSVGRGILADAEDERRVAAATSAPASTSSSTDLDPNTTPAGEYLMDKIKKGFKSIVSGPVTRKADGGLVGGDRYYGKK